MYKSIFAIVALTILATFIGNGVNAVQYSVTGNGTGSNNSINVQSTTGTTVNQTNQGSVSNDINANANTGGNTTNNGSVQTGGANVNVNVTNNLNTNNAQTGCCGSPTPKPTIGDPGAPSNPNTPGNGSTTSNGSGGTGGAAAKQGEILGLSATSGEGNTQAILTTLGLLCLSIGGALVRSSKKLVG